MLLILIVNTNNNIYDKILLLIIPATSTPPKVPTAAVIIFLFIPPNIKNVKIIITKDVNIDIDIGLYPAKTPFINMKNTEKAVTNKPSIAFIPRFPPTKIILNKNITNIIYI